MRRFLIPIGVSAVAAGAAAAAVLASGASPARPALRLVATEPLTVRGLNFGRHERVTVSAAGRTEEGATEKRSKLVTTGDRGGFTVVLEVTFDQCSYFGVQARSESGKRAAIKIVPQCGALP